MRDKVIIIGAGMMGSGIAAMSALSGRGTILVDISETQLKSGLEKAISCIHLREQNGVNSKDDSERAISLIETSLSIEKSCMEAFFIIEAINENLSLKQNIFQQLDKTVPSDIPICSNTSGLRITEISQKCTHPERTITTHFWLPAHLIPLVEVVMGEKTGETIAGKVMNELKKWQKEPILVRKDCPGQLANRIFQAIIREAVDIVASGLASAEDVDKAISCGMAMRFPVWGPLTHLDAIGLDLGLRVQDAVLPNICAEKEGNPYLKEMIDNGNIGVQSGKGFFDWNERNIENAIIRRDRFILEAVKILRNLEIKSEE